jgi:hypothetical protein
VPNSGAYVQIYAKLYCMGLKAGQNFLATIALLLGDTAI